jgi:hypothetical protein
MKRHATPIIAAVVLLLPVLYVGSYLALVNPGAAIRVERVNYRAGAHHIAMIFWPLEHIDRMVRPGAWRPEPIVY